MVNLALNSIFCNELTRRVHSHPVLAQGHTGATGPQLDERLAYLEILGLKQEKREKKESKLQ